MRKQFTRDFSRPFQPISRDKMPIEKTEREHIRIYQGVDSKDYAEQLEHIYSKEMRQVFERVLDIARDVRDEGGTAYIVGGAVRDEILGTTAKDFDIEIHGLHPDIIEKIASKYGRVDTVGKSFGILVLMDKSGFNIDLSVPRRDSKISEGHKGFRIEPDPNMGIIEAARRRDFTFNSMLKNPLTGEIFDPFNGVQDLRMRILKVVDPKTFVDDPLRVLRAARFVAQCGVRITPLSMDILRQTMFELTTIPRERFRGEWEKILLKSAKPSMGLHALHEIGVLDLLYPELLGLTQTEQNPEKHPEGNVWHHTLLSVDAGAEIVKRERLEGEQAQVVMWSSLCHDFGKSKATKRENDKIISDGHETVVQPIIEFLDKIGVQKKMIEKVVQCARWHMWPARQYRIAQNGQHVKDGAFYRLAMDLHPATITELSYVSEADNLGRGPFLDKNNIDQFLLPNPFIAGEWLRYRAEELGVSNEKPKPLILGRDLIDLGYKPSALFGKILRLSDDVRDELGWTREDLLAIIRDECDLETVVRRMEAVLGKLNTNIDN